MEFNTQVTAHKDDTYALSINLDYGFMSPDDLIKIAELAKKYNVTKMMATTAKKVSFYNFVGLYMHSVFEKSNYCARITSRIRFNSL